MTLTCHGFKSQQEADQAREADPAAAVTVPEGHEVQQLVADGDPCKEAWTAGWVTEQQEAGAGPVLSQAKSKQPLGVVAFYHCSLFCLAQRLVHFSSCFY